MGIDLSKYESCLKRYNVSLSYMHKWAEEIKEDKGGDEQREILKKNERRELNRVLRKLDKNPTGAVALLLLRKMSRSVPDMPEAQLIWAFFERVVDDAIVSTPKESEDRESARRYLAGPMKHLTMIGMEPSYVRRVFKMAGIDLTDLDSIKAVSK